MGLSNAKNPNYIQGGFIPRHPEKYSGDPSKIFLRSSWERRVAIYFDNNPNVLKWNSEQIVIPYISPIDNQVHRYYIDFFARIKTSNGIKDFLVEVKPFKDGQPPKNIRRKKVSTVMYEERTFLVNQAKWAYAREFARKRGMEFIVLTESEIFGR